MAFRWPGRHRRSPAPTAPPGVTIFFEEQSAYADRLTLAVSFAADDETRPNAQDLQTYRRLSWYRGWHGAERPVRPRH